MVFTPQTTRDYYYYVNDEPLVYRKQGGVWHPPTGTLGIVNTLIWIGYHGVRRKVTIGKNIMVKNETSNVHRISWDSSKNAMITKEKNKIINQTWIHSTPRSVKQLPSSSNLKTKTPEPNFQSQSFSRSDGLFCQLPFTCFILWTMGCQPRRPDAVMDTIIGAKKMSFGFSRAVGSASDTSNDKVLYQPINPIARQSDFREKGW